MSLRASAAAAAAAASSFVMEPPHPSASASASASAATNTRQLVEAMTPVIQPRLIPYALDLGNEFTDVDSYQSKALDRLALQTSVASFSDAKLVQYYVLYCILEATNGLPNVLTSADPRFDVFNSTDNFPKWTTTNGWLSQDRDPCGNATAGVAPWYGITCDDQGRVTEISLVKNLLTGYFPPEVKLLAGEGQFSGSGAGYLTYLELYDNEFLFNNFDNSWMTDLGSQLEYLFVGGTGFGGRFPQLPVGVIEADFAWTLIHKGFDDPDVFAYTPLLEYLNLGGTALNTTLPSTLVSLPNLQYLYINDCLLQGDLSFITQMPSIYELWIDSNRELTGGIPSGLSTVTTLASISLTDNGLTGPIPTTLGALSNLQQLWLYDNDLTGNVPTELGSLKVLHTLQVEGNAVVGTMPTEVCYNTGYFGKLKTVGGDCNDENFDCPCCTCCDLNECQPDVYPATASPTPVPVFTMNFTSASP